MTNKSQSSEKIREIFDSLPSIDSSRPDLRIINFELLESIVAQAELKANLQGSIDALKDADNIVSKVFSESFPSL